MAYLVFSSVPATVSVGAVYATPPSILNPDINSSLPSLNRVDPALLRPGRCFEKLQFSRLTGDDLAKAQSVIGNEYFEGIRTPQEGFTIAELFAIRNNEPIDIIDRSTGFGFTRG
jgi:hypothetical protein